ncbi:MAG: hypothetical protein GX074_00900 [Erysipelothrix sp.]|nr:hypothetical protein [Erysipelothrix sp.]
MNPSNIYAMRMALFIFPFVAAIFLIPYLIYQYQRHGSLVLFKAFVTYAFIYYLINACFLVMLPLYPRSVVAAFTGPKYDLQLFGFIRELSRLGLLEISSKRDIINLITNERFLEPFFNVILTIPFGVFLRYYFKRDWWEVIIYSFLLSLTFELTQLSGLFGFYSRPHRLFQVDDLMLNTIGGTIGYILTPLFVFMFPTKDRMVEVAQKRSNNVGPVRRILALTIDMGIILIIGVIAFNFIYKDVSLLNILKNYPKYTKELITSNFVYLSFTLMYLFFMLFVPAVLNGSTIGKKIVRIKLVNSDGSKLSFTRLLGYTTFTFVIANIYYVSLLIYLNLFDSPYIISFAIEYNFYIIYGVTVVLLMAYTYNALMYKRTLQESISRTKHVTI